MEESRNRSSWRGGRLLATRVLSRLQEGFGVEVSVRRFFEAPTISALAAAVEAGSAVEARATVPSMARIPSLFRGARSLETLLNEVERGLRTDAGTGAG